MRNFEFYEFVGVLAPGTFLLTGLSLLWPQHLAPLASLNVSFGGFGLVVVLAYVVGQLLQSFGNLVEWLYWKLWGGMPTNWIRSKKQSLVAAEQLGLIVQKIASTCGVVLPADLSTLKYGSWQSIIRQVYAVVKKAGQAERVDIFNGNYGMFRGIATASLILFMCSLVLQLNWGIIFFLIASILAFFRMHRFGRYYARELFVQFIQVKI